MKQYVWLQLPNITVAKIPLEDTKTKQSMG